MIISEKQIMKLMHFSRVFQTIIVSENLMVHDEGAKLYSRIGRLLLQITNQQSEELKEID